MRPLATLALAAGLCACTPMEWAKPDVSAEQFRADEKECRDYAWREASLRGWRYQVLTGPVFARDSTGRGFFLWPSTAFVDPYGHQLLEEQRLAQSCMESKGYKLVPAPKK